MHKGIIISPETYIRTYVGRVVVTFIVVIIPLHAYTIAIGEHTYYVIILPFLLEPPPNLPELGTMVNTYVLSPRDIPIHKESPQDWPESLHCILFPGKETSNSSFRGHITSVRNVLG